MDGNNLSTQCPHRPQNSPSLFTALETCDELKKRFGNLWNDCGSLNSTACPSHTQPTLGSASPFLSHNRRPRLRRRGTQDLSGHPKQVGDLWASILFSGERGRWQGSGAKWGVRKTECDQLPREGGKKKVLKKKQSSQIRPNEPEGVSSSLESVNGVNQSKTVPTSQASAHPLSAL